MSTFAKDIHDHLEGKQPFTLAELGNVFTKAGTLAIQQELDALLKVGSVAVETVGDETLWRWQEEKPKQGGLF
jgi:hypothetical protein